MKGGSRGVLVRSRKNQPCEQAPLSRAPRCPSSRHRGARSICCTGYMCCQMYPVQQYSSCTERFHSALLMCCSPAVPWPAWPGTSASACSLARLLDSSSNSVDRARFTRQVHQQAPRQGQGVHRRRRRRRRRRRSSRRRRRRARGGSGPGGVRPRRGQRPAVGRSGAGKANPARPGKLGPARPGRLMHMRREGSKDS
jgi:hypothetical protein